MHAFQRWADGPRAEAASTSDPARARRAASLCVASGKGGTGKSVVASSLACLLRARGRTLLVDADMGVGNAHLMFDLSPARSFVDVVAGRCTVAEARAACLPGLELVGAGSGVSRMSALSAYEMHLIARGLQELDGEYAHLVVDSAAGISEQTVGFAAACDVVVLVTTPDVTAMTDAYAFLKVLWARRRESRVLLVVNRVPAEPGEGALVARHVGERIAAVSEKFLGRAPSMLCAVPEDAACARSLALRKPLVVAEPGAPATVALQAASVVLADELDGIAHGGLGWRLADAVGFSTASA
ncbi:MAG TPA: P-loop NTPase [Planctomycetota bacterium]|nr:P-loop NTPase [Planctomycetota bacterium]